VVPHRLLLLACVCVWHDCACSGLRRDGRTELLRLRLALRLMWLSRRLRPLLLLHGCSRRCDTSLLSEWLHECIGEEHRLWRCSGVRHRRRRIAVQEHGVGIRSGLCIVSDRQTRR
jgi:hypothetical protein